MKKQNGFLSFVAVFLILIAGFLGVATAYHFTNGAVANSQSYASSQAYYTALAGTEYAERQLTANNVSCSSINYTNLALPGVTGTTNVTGTSNTASSTIAGLLVTASANTIQLASSAGFSANGVVSIDNELISYTGISGNNLTNARRGVNGTTAAIHVIGANVTQNECLITSTGNVTTSGSSSGERVSQGIVTGNGFSLGPNGSGGVITPTLTAVGNVTQSGGFYINNPNVTSSSPNFAGSTVNTAGTLTISGTQTQINNGSGILTASSTPGNLKADVTQHNSDLTASNLFGYFFSQSKSNIQAAADQSYTSANINGVTGKTIWMNSSLVVSGITTIGSPTSPVILIINGSLVSSGVLTVYGFVYTTGGIIFSGTTNTFVGAVATEGAVTSSGSGSMSYDVNILNKLNMMNSNSKAGYSGSFSSLQEVTH